MQRNMKNLETAHEKVKTASPKGITAAKAEEAAEKEKMQKTAVIFSDFRTRSNSKGSISEKAPNKQETVNSNPVSSPVSSEPQGEKPAKPSRKPR